LIQGVVQKIIHNQQYGLYSFFMKGQDGMYSLGERAPTFKEGDSIKFETDQKGKYLYAKDIVPWEGTGTGTAPPVQAVARSYGRGGFVGGKAGKSDEEKAYWANKDLVAAETQKRIEIQAARNAAIEAARFLVEKEYVKTPTKQADKYDAYLALVNQLTDEFIKNTAGRLVGDAKPPSDVDSAGTGESTSQSNEAWD
jgi:hypothetical protein